LQSDNCEYGVCANYIISHDDNANYFGCDTPKESGDVALLGRVDRP